MNTRRIIRRRRDWGGVTMLLVAILVAVAGVVGILAVRGATSDLSNAGAQRLGRTGFYCAEAGLNAARPFFSLNAGSWNTMLAGTAFTGYPVVGDLDGDGNNDFSVTIVDNYDEFPTSNPAADADGVVIMVSQCISTTLSASSTGRTVKQIVSSAPIQGTDYRYQAGHSSAHSGNAN